MAVYIELMASCLLFHVITQLYPYRNVRNAFLIFLLSLLTMVSGFRVNVGADYHHYVDVFEWINNPYLHRDYEEIGFRALNIVLGRLSIGYRGIFLISAALLSISLYYFVQEFVPEKFWVLFVFLFVCGGSFFSSMNILRQYMAMSFALLAIVMFVREKYLASLAFAVLMVLFHKSSLIFLILPIMIYIFSHKNTKIYIVVLYFLSFFLAFINVNQIASFVVKIIPAWHQYLGSALLVHRNSGALLKAIVPNLVVLYGYGQASKEQNMLIVADDCSQEVLSRNNRVVFSGAVIFSLSTIPFAGIIALTRLSEYFSPFLYAYITVLLSHEIRKRANVFQTLMIAYYSVLTIVTILLWNGNKVIPYHSLLSYLQF